MRKKEVRWISRDEPTGAYDTWKEEPRKAKSGYYRCSKGGTIIARGATRNERFDVTLIAGGLAKVTIERQY